MALDLQIRQRAALDKALDSHGRDPAEVGILWQTPIVVRESHDEAVAQRERLLTSIPHEAVGVYLSHNSGYDFSKLPARFSLGELNQMIAATGATPVGFVYELAHKLGADTEITPADFFEHGMRSATSYDTTIAGNAREMANILEEKFEATGSRGGFMLGHVVSTPLDLEAISDILVPELQRRGRFRREYTGRTLRENLAQT